MSNEAKSVTERTRQGSMEDVGAIERVCASAGPPMADKSYLLLAPFRASNLQHPFFLPFCDDICFVCLGS